MDEEKTTEEQEQENSKENTWEGIQSETAKETERINSETERLKKAIAEKENAEARAKIAGVTDAGIQPEKPVEETPAEYKDRILRGE